MTRSRERGVPSEAKDFKAKQEKPSVESDLSDVESVVLEPSDISREGEVRRDSAVLPAKEEREVKVEYYASPEDEESFLQKAKSLRIPDELLRFFYKNDEQKKGFLKYRDLKELVRGVGRILFKAEYIPFKIQVAIKIDQIFSESYAKEGMEVKRQEMINLAKLSHTNIARIYLGGVNEKGIVFSQELVDGYELNHHDFLAKDLPVDKLLRIFIGIAKGLKVVHEKGLVHRDIKPANIVVPKDNQGEIEYDEAKIIDFGISFQQEEPSLKNKILKFLGKSKKFRHAGTPGYMSPEQYWREYSSHKINSSTDTFSLGLTIFEALAARPTHEIVKKAYKSKAVKLKEIFPDDDFSKIPDELLKLIEDMLAYNPEERPSDQEVIDELNNTLEKLKS